MGKPPKYRSRVPSVKTEAILPQRSIVRINTLKIVRHSDTTVMGATD